LVDSVECMMIHGLANPKFVELHVSVTSNHHQTDISIHGHDMFSAYIMECHIVYICCVEFQTFRLINCSIFNILTNVFSEIM
jgi:hypothetical protein